MPISHRGLSLGEGRLDAVLPTRNGRDFAGIPDLQTEGPRAGSS